ncbi:exported protein of unknown function, might related with Protein YnjH [Shewanella benthica]|uniref:DUF1496 domain-containing protein n=1 Tax=Shewanella benthica TaxID=43661 RepID=A0A330M1Q8_9GAMM|nr:DUF1496 domain-containing protein [Shewanella benthica]SQH75464.1 exported protein of unknown function, might related with Protein YnjH [Shewanella benthica]
MKRVVLFIGIVLSFSVNAQDVHPAEQQTTNKLNLAEQVDLYNKINRKDYCVYKNNLYTINSVVNQDGVVLYCYKSYPNYDLIWKLVKQ